MAPALFSASKAMPADIAPSPMTAMHAPVFPFQLCRHRHAERRGDRGRGMRGAEGVVARLGAAREARDAVDHAQARHRLAPSGEDLVRVGLVPDVPDDAVLGRVEHVVQRDGELDRAEVGGEVPAGLRHRLEHEGAQLLGELRAAAGARACAAAPDRRSSSAARTSMDCSRRPAGRPRGCSCLEFSQNDEVGERGEPAGPAAQALRAPSACARRLLRISARARDAHGRDVGRLALLRVLAGGLAQRRGAGLARRARRPPPGKRAPLPWRSGPAVAFSASLKRISAGSAQAAPRRGSARRSCGCA